MKVLLVEDDADLLDLLTYALGREGYTVLTAMDGQQAIRRWEESSPDIVLLDANLPKVDGYEVCRRLRHEGATPIIMLTARDEEEDVLHGFRVGADDYVNKPFSAKQLGARIKAVLRRAQADPYRQPVREVKIGEVRLDLQSYGVTAGDRQIQLTPLEFRILYLLGVNEGRVIPYSRLVEYAWGYEGGDSSLLKTHICHIRQKLNLSAGKNGGIRAVPGVGYSLAMS
ncbi:MAG TPA: response regulator transcription factor [Candidatus Limnocylindria bacterium]